MLIKGVEWKAPNFKIVPAVAKTLDPTGAQSQTPAKVILIEDICTHFKCSIRDIGNLEIDNALNQLCVDGSLKPEFAHLENKGLTHTVNLPRVFHTKWVRFILSRVHYGEMWIDQPVSITKKMIHKITGLPILSKAKTTKTLPRKDLEKEILAEWDGRGSKINTAIDL